MLRAGTPSDVVVFDGDDEPDTFHLGARLGNHLIGVSTWLSRPAPGRPPSTRAVQLRGMAVEPANRGGGVGEALLDAGVERCRRSGVEVVWARARTTALGFYLAHGFETEGDTFVDQTTGLAHRTIVRPLPRGR